MKWVRDNSGRFRERPHYHPDELEQLCEDTMTRFLWDRHGRVAFPASTEDLTVLLEREVDDLDNGCVLEDGVDGLTDFFPRRKPHVKIASRLQAPNYENRLRTTLTHECGHVLVHGFLFALEDGHRKVVRGRAAENTQHLSQRRDRRAQQRLDGMAGGVRLWGVVDAKNRTCAGCPGVPCHRRLHVQQHSRRIGGRAGHDRPHRGGVSRVPRGCMSATGTAANIGQDGGSWFVRLVFFGMLIR